MMSTPTRDRPASVDRPGCLGGEVGVVHPVGEEADDRGPGAHRRLALVQRRQGGHVHAEERRGRPRVRDGNGEQEGQDEKKHRCGPGHTCTIGPRGVRAPSPICGRRG